MESDEIRYHEMIAGPLDGDHIASAEEPQHDKLFVAGRWVYCYDARREAWIFVGYRAKWRSAGAL